MKCFRLAASHVQSACLFFSPSYYCFYITVMSENTLLFLYTLLDKVGSIKLWFPPFRWIPDYAHSLHCVLVPFLCKRCTEMALKDDVNMYKSFKSLYYVVFLSVFTFSSSYF